MENPHATIVRSHQHWFCVIVWAGVVDDFLLGPYIFPECQHLFDISPKCSAWVTYLNPLNIRRSMRFQHDGAPPHFGKAVCGHLAATFGACWIGTLAWTDLPRFFLWDYMKSMVYETDIDPEEDLVLHIVSAAAEIREIPDIFGRVRQSMAWWCTVWMSMDVCSNTYCDGTKNWIRPDSETLKWAFLFFF